MTAKAIFFLGLSLGAVSFAAQAADRVPDSRAVLPLFQPAYPYGADPQVAARDADRAVTDMNDAIRLAYWTNPNLLAERATLRSTDAHYPEARAAYGPQLVVRGEHAFARDRIELAPGVFSADSGFASTASAIFSQPVLSFGRRASAERGALGLIALGRDQLRLTEAQTMLDVITHYISVIRDREVLQIARENLILLERQYRDDSERFRVREITSTDLQQVQTRVEFGRAQVFASQGQLGMSQALFLRSVGAVAGPLTQPAPLPLGVATLEDAYAAAERSSPLVRGAQSREKVSRANLEAARAEQMPLVSTNASAVQSAVSPYANDRRAFQVRGTVSIEVPLIDSGVRRARIEQARQLNEADWRLVDQALRDTRQAVASAWDSYKSAEASLDHYSLASEAAQKAYDGALAQEKAGARTTLDVLDLARDLLNVRTNYVTAQANAFIARANVRAAMGTLEAPMLIPDIRTYDPRQNFDRQKGRGDIPLLTPVLSAFDSAFARRDVRTDRPVRDPAGPLKVPSAVMPE